MSFHVFKVQSMRDKMKNLKDISRLQAKLSAKKELESQTKTEKSERYKKLFEPVTSSLSRLQAVQLPPQIVAAVPPPVGRDLDEEFEGGIPSSHDGTRSRSSSGGTTATFRSVPSNLDEDDVDLFGGEEEEVKEQRPPSLYDEALKEVPSSLWDDGLFGLNVREGTIGSYCYNVVNDILYIYHKPITDGQLFKRYDIDDIDYWKFLIAQRPREIGLDISSKFGVPQPFLRQYRQLVQDLQLVEHAKRGGGKYKNRAKYKMLQASAAAAAEVVGRKRKGDSAGTGFLFSYRGPRGRKLVHPSTVVIPSDKAGLQRALLTALVELRSGNTSMQNIVVPLARAAKRKRILPPNLLSPGETNWIFA